MLQHTKFTEVLKIFIISDIIFKTGEHWSQAGSPGFLKLFLCRHLYVCMFLCACPKGVNN